MGIRATSDTSTRAHELQSIGHVWNAASGVASASVAGQDRVLVVERKNRKVILVADGAGGMGYGAEAAEFLVAETRDNAQSSANRDWATFLTYIDRRLAESRGSHSSLQVPHWGHAGRWHRWAVQLRSSRSHSRRRAIEELG